MGKYGNVALRATRLVQDGSTRSATEAWEAAARAVFPHQLEARKKGCPRNTFLGLCEEGLVLGIPPGRYTSSVENKAYGVEAVRLLERDAGLAVAGPAVLWTRVMRGNEKKANSQMDVVLTLWANGLIRRSAGGL